MFRKPLTPAYKRAAERPPTMAGSWPADTNEALARLMSRWTAEKTEPLPPADPRDVQRVFARLGHVATSDVIALFSVIGGMKVMDDEYLELWSLDRIAAQEPCRDGVVFADYLLSCWEYRLVPTAGGQSAVWCDHYTGSASRVGLTLDAFLASYARDRDFLHGWS